MKIDYNGESQVVAIEGMRYMHHVVEITPLHLKKPDTLAVTWDINMILTGGGNLSMKKFQCKALITETEATVRFIELFYFGGQFGTLKVHETWEFPK